MLYLSLVGLQEIKMSMMLSVSVFAAIFLAALCHTSHGFVSPGIGLLLKVSALRGRGTAVSYDAVKRRETGALDVAIVDGRPDLHDGVIREELDLILPGRTLAAHLYHPGSADPHCLIISYHGGGFVVGSLETNERLARDLCRKTKSIVLSVAYRLAPEHTFPAAHDDALDSFFWVHEAQTVGRLPRLPVWVSGDSAGANLAAAVCLMARSLRAPLPAGQVLFYPVTDVSKMDTESYRSFGTGYLLTKGDMEWFRAQYLVCPDQRLDPRVSPLLEPDLSGLPPALVLTAGKDVLRDEGEAYVTRLQNAGVAVELHRFSGLVHGFVQMRRFAPTAWKVPRLVRRFIHEHGSV